MLGKLFLVGSARVLWWLLGGSRSLCAWCPGFKARVGEVLVGWVV